MIFTGNHGRRRAQNNGQTNSQRRRSSNLDVRKNDDDRTTIYPNKNVSFDVKNCLPSLILIHTNMQGRSKASSSSRLSRDNSRESPSHSSYLHSHSSSSSSGSSNYYSLPRTSSSSTYMTIPELDEPKHDFYLQKTRARDITKRRGAIKLIQRPT